MSQQVISYADLSVINSALRSISADLSGMHVEMGDMNRKQDQIEDDLLQLSDAFADFVKADIKHKALQLAETRQGNLKQDLQIKFGYYSEVRRMATGILQGVDTGVVGDDTLRFTTEEVMIKAPGYWLAPAMIALVAWIRNDKIATNKALTESLKRDDYKTTLLFLLIMRRLARNDASFQWLERYFLHQNPHDLDREFIIILEAVTTGVFPPAARLLMMSKVKSWIDHLTRTDNYVNEQKARWTQFFKAKGPSVNSPYPYLEKFATNWPALETSLKEAKTHAILQKHFEGILSSNTDFSKAVKVQLDEILTLLVTNFDDEEIPLQEQVRLNQLIIQMDGDKQAAQAMMDAEKHVFDEKVDFLQMLTNAAFNPELSGATKATQVLAVSISQPWIVEAHDSFTANCRINVPQEADLSIDSFTTFTQNGSDEEAQLAKHENYWSILLQDELAKISFPYSNILLGFLIGALGYFGFTFHPAVGITGLAIGVWVIWSGFDQFKTSKRRIMDSIEERKIKSREVLRGCIAETVDYRRELAAEDAKAEALRALLTSISPEDFSSVSKETKTIFQAQSN
jgi:hypothetical protein